MSMNLMVLAMKAKVGNPIRKLVLIKLADNANDHGECWPSYKHIADQCEIDRSTVRRHIKALEQSSLLKIETRKGPKGNSSNLYVLSLHPVGTESTPCRHRKHPPVGTESTGTYQLEPTSEPSDLFFEDDKPENTFDDWYKHYPIKKGRGQAERAFKAAIKEVAFDDLVKATKAYAAQFEGKDKTFVKHPSTWLNGQCWLDDAGPAEQQSDQSIRYIHGFKHMRCGGDWLPEQKYIGDVRYGRNEAGEWEKWKY